MFYLIVFLVPKSNFTYIDNLFEFFFEILVIMIADEEMHRMA